MEQSTEAVRSTDLKVEKSPPEGTESARGTETETGTKDTRHHESLSSAFDEPSPHLHAKTFFAVLAICMLYFTQNFCIVGAGAVSISSYVTGHIPAACSEF